MKNNRTKSLDFLNDSEPSRLNFYNFREKITFPTRYKIIFGKNKLKIAEVKVSNFKMNQVDSSYDFCKVKTVEIIDNFVIVIIRITTFGWYNSKLYIATGKLLSSNDDRRFSRQIDRCK